MSSWLLPAIKLVANNLDTIVDATKPLFTRRKANEPANQSSLVQQQIAELQAAASENSMQIHEIAEQLKATIEALEASVSMAEQREKNSRRLMVTALWASAIAVMLALISLGVALPK